MGGTLLMNLEEAWIFGMWPKRLLIFEDRIEARDFELANLMVPIQGSSPILIGGLSKDDAERARGLIEERVGWANSSPSQTPSPPNEERLIQGLTELRHAGILREEEFEIKRKEVMNPHLKEWACHSNSPELRERTTIGCMTSALLRVCEYRPHAECKDFTGRHFTLPNLTGLRLSKTIAVCSERIQSALSTPIVPDHGRLPNG